MHKNVLRNKSLYFNAMFSYEELEENRKNMVTFDTYLLSFIFVLKLVYGCSVTSDSWSLKSLTDLIEMLIIIKRFLISSDIEEVVTKHFIYKLGLLETDPKKEDYKESVFHNLSLLCETYRLADYYSFDCLLNECHNYFDQNATHVLYYFEKKSKLSPELIRKIIGRDTFGVEEMKIFNLVKKMIRKNGLESTKPLIESIRFSLLTTDQISIICRSNLLDGIIGDSIENFIKTTFGSPSRVCLERERLFKTKDISYERATLSRTLTLRLASDLGISRSDLNPIHLTTIQLSIETLINHIVLEVELNRKADSFVSFNYFIRIVLYSSSGQMTRFRYFLTPVQEIHEYYFVPKLVSYIHIYCDKQIVIKSLSYEMTSNVKEDKFLSLSL